MFTVRAAWPEDSPALQDIERLAGERFREVGLDSVADHEPASVDELTEYADDGRAWVAVGTDDAPLGYLLVDDVDGDGHVEQMSVRPDHHGRGIGRALMDRARAWADDTGRAALTLTTFTHVSWNRPLYEHLGFRVLDDSEVGPELRALRDQEAAHGLDPALRVCMRLDLDALRPLPAGRVTFLFTDIEGSTKLFHRLGPAYRPVLEQHRRLLRQAFTRHGGVVVGTDGDGFFVAFPTAAGALAACLDGQRAVEAHEWPAGTRIRVRMGMHTGDAEPAGHDYIAFPVHQAARVAAAGHGGQVLVSAVSHEDVDDALPPGVTLVPLGAYQLKDFDEPQPLWQLAHPDLPSEFPALKVLPAEGHNLPVARTSFVGREDDIATVAALVAATPLVTVTGPGGVGKTRLALEVARQVFPSFPDGVWWVPLAPLADSGALESAVASVLGIREEPGRPLHATLTDGLRPRRLLLLLDNCEHLTAACAAMVDVLLDAAPGLRVLATSREPLGVVGERVVAADPLGDTDSVRLFVARAEATRDDFTLDDSNTDAVTRICHALDGLPLALELAAARVVALSPEQILDKLEKRLPLLAGGPRSAPERQRTLRGTIAWSHDLLAVDEQRLFRRLAVFRGGCTLDAAEHVAGADLDHLQSLVEKSLVRAADGRFSMLETIREFAAEELAASDEADDLARHHAEFYGAVAPPLGSRARNGDVAALAAIDADYDNALTAFDWALAHDTFAVSEQLVDGLWYSWVRRGLTSDGYRRTRAVVDRAPAPTARLLTLAGELARFTGDLARAVAFKHAALAAFEAEGAGDADLAACHTDMAEALVELDRLDEAQAEADRGMAMRERDGHPYGIAHARVPLVLLELRRGHDAAAAALSELSMPVFRTHETWSDLAWECVRAATAYRRMGDLSLATDRLRECFRLAAHIAEAAVTAAAIEQTAAVAVAVGDDEAALVLFGAAATARRTTGYVMTTDDSALAGREPATRHPSSRRAARRGRGLALDDAVARSVGFLGVPESD